MAYPSDIKTADLKHMATCLRAVAGDSALGRKPRNGFETASRCLDMLGVLAQSLRDRYPGVERAAQWGPGYVNFRDDDGLYHYLSVVFYRKPWKRNHLFHIQLAVPQDAGELRWALEYHEGSEETDKFTWDTLRRVGIRRGVLDGEALLAKTLACAKKWKVRL